MSYSIFSLLYRMFTVGVANLVNTLSIFPIQIHC